MRQRLVIDFELPDGRMKRVRKVSPIQTKRGAEEYELQLRQSLLTGLRKKGATIPMLSAFAKDFLAYAETNNKPS